MLLCGLHILDLWEDGHSIATILTTLIEVVIVERGFVGPEGWQHILDAGGASHSGHIIMTGLEGVPQVDDVVTNIQQMFAEVWEGLRQLLDARTLERLVIGRNTDIHRDVLTQLLS